MTVSNCWTGEVMFTAFDANNDSSTVQNLSIDAMNIPAIISICALNSKIKFNRSDIPFSQREVLGDATETGLTRFAAKYLSDYDATRDASPAVYTVPFNSETKSESHLCSDLDSLLTPILSQPRSSSSRSLTPTVLSPSSSRVLPSESSSAARPTSILKASSRTSTRRSRSPTTLPTTTWHLVDTVSLPALSRSSTPRDTPRISSSPRPTLRLMATPSSDSSLSRTLPSTVSTHT